MNATKSYVVIDRNTARAIAHRTRRLESLIVEVRRSQLNDRALLENALVELALARHAKDTRDFVRRWMQAHRTPEEETGVPIVRK